MHQGKRQRRRIERLDREMQHHAGILADRVKHHRLSELRGHLPHDLDRFGFQSLEMSGQRLASFGYA